MGWATEHIQRLKNGETITIFPKGNSMTPVIKSGDKCVIVPRKREIRKGDIVLCSFRKAQYLHWVMDVKGDQVQIGNNQGYINGWTKISNVFGILEPTVDQVKEMYFVVKRMCGIESPLSSLQKKMQSSGPKQVIQAPERIETSMLTAKRTIS